MVPETEVGTGAYSNASYLRMCACMRKSTDILVATVVI